MFENVRLSYPDPNLNANRVPSEAELITLRDLLKRNEDIKTNLNQQLEELKQRRAAIHERCERQRRVFESVLSELHTSNQSIQTLETHKSMIQSDLDQLYGLICPIRRFPFEILERIFKYTVQIAHIGNKAATPIENFVTATRLSHVCSKWRQTSIEIPFLWSIVPISVTSDLGTSREYINRTQERIKQHPPHVILTNIDYQHKNRGTVPEIISYSFQKFPKMQCLEIELLEYSMTVLRSAIIQESTKSDIKHLCVRQKNPTVKYPSYLSAIGDILSKTSSLSLQSLEFECTSKATNHIHHLQLDSCPSVCLWALFYDFPALETIVFTDVNFVPTNTFLSYKSLRSISIANMRQFPWSCLNVDRVVSVSIHRLVEVPEAFRQFLYRHPSIEQLDIRDSPHVITDILQNVPKIRSLTIPSSNEVASISQTEFRSLATLSLYQTTRAQLSLDHFERIVTTHCMNTRLVEKSGMEVEKPLTLQILVLEGLEFGELEWRKSRLLESAREECYYDERWGDRFAICRLEWP